MSNINKVKKKYLYDDQVDGQKVLFLNQQFFRALDENGIARNIFQILNGNTQYAKAPTVVEKGTEPLSLITREEMNQAITELIDFSPEALNTLGEIVTELQSSTAATTQAISAINAKTFDKEHFILTDDDVTNGYIFLNNINIYPDSMTSFQGRLGMHLNYDYELSEENGKTKVTFINDMAAGGVEAIERDYHLFFTYYFSNA